MNKISKILVMAVVILVVVTISLSVNAVSNSDLISYVTGEHTVLGTKYQLSSEQKDTVKNYLTQNPVDDATAESIKADLVEAVNQLNATGATGLDKVSDSAKAKVTSLLKSAGSKAGLVVTVDTSAKTITVKDGSGNTLISNSYTSAVASTSASVSQSTSGTLVYTGTSYIVGISILAIIAVAIVLVLRKKA